jgi:hypothetical protein
MEEVQTCYVLKINILKQKEWKRLHYLYTPATNWLHSKIEPITMAARSKAWIVFARSNAEIVGSNPTQGMDVCIVCDYSVCVVLCVGRGLARGWSPVEGVLQTVYRIKKLKRDQGPTKCSRAIIIMWHVNLLLGNARNTYTVQRATMQQRGYATTR